MIDLIIGIFIILFLVMVLFLKIEFFFIVNLFFVALMSALRLDPTTSIVNILGISLYAKDIFFLSEMLFLLIFFAQQLIINPKFFSSKYFQIPFLILCIVVLKVLFAFPDYGTMAFLSSKNFLFFFGNILFFSVYPLSDKRILKIFKAIFYFSLIYTMIGILRYIDILPSIYSNYLGSLSWAIDFNTQRLFDRSDLEVILMGSFYVLTFLLISFKDNLYRYLPIFIWLSSFILLSNTRSMIVTSLFILFYSFYLHQDWNAKKTIQLFFAFFPIIFIVLIVFQFSSISAPAFSYESLFGEQSTFVFRNIVNLAYLNYMNFESYFFGMTFGNTPIVFPETYFNTIQGGKVGLHNSYIELVYFFGIPFTLFLFYALRNIIKRLFYLRKSNTNNPLINLSIICIISYLIISTMWTVDQFSGIIFGLSIASIKYFDHQSNRQSIEKNI